MIIDGVLGGWSLEHCADGAPDKDAKNESTAVEDDFNPYTELVNVHLKAKLSLAESA